MDHDRRHHHQDTALDLLVGQARLVGQGGVGHEGVGHRVIRQGMIRQSQCLMGVRLIGIHCVIGIGL